MAHHRVRYGKLFAKVAAVIQERADSCAGVSVMPRYGVFNFVMVAQRGGVDGLRHGAFSCWLGLRSCYVLFSAARQSAILIPHTLGNKHNCQGSGKDYKAELEKLRDHIDRELKRLE